jgi:hypothetical protein
MRMHHSTQNDLAPLVTLQELANVTARSPQAGIWQMVPGDHKQGLSPDHCRKVPFKPEALASRPSDTVHPTIQPSERRIRNTSSYNSRQLQASTSQINQLIYLTHESLYYKLKFRLAATA